MDIRPNVQRHQSIYVPEVSGGNGTPKISSGNRVVGEIDVCIFVY